MISKSRLNILMLWWYVILLLFFRCIKHKYAYSSTPWVLYNLSWFSKCFQTQLIKAWKHVKLFLWFIIPPKMCVFHFFTDIPNKIYVLLYPFMHQFSVPASSHSEQERVGMNASCHRKRGRIHHRVTQRNMHTHIQACSQFTITSQPNAFELLDGAPRENMHRDNIQTPQTKVAEIAKRHFAVVWHHITVILRTWKIHTLLFENEQMMGNGCGKYFHYPFPLL